MNHLIYFLILWNHCHLLLDSVVKTFVLYISSGFFWGGWKRGVVGYLTVNGKT